MTIANGSTILQADLNAMSALSLSKARLDNARLSGGIPLTVTFHGLVASTPVYASKSRIVIPVDMLVDSLVVLISPGTATTTVTVDVTGDGALPNFAMRIIGTVDAGVAVLPARLLFDNNMSANPGVSPQLTSRVARLLPRGSTILITATTTNIVATMSVQVTLAGRSRLARETA